MKSIKIILIYLTITVSIYGQNIMSIPDIVGESGDTVEVRIDIENSENFVAFQTDVILPNQVEYIPNSAALTNRSNGHSISANLIDPQTLRLIAFSVSQNQFTGNSGSVLSFKVKLKSIPGYYNFELVNSIISNNSSQNILTSFTNGQINLIAPDISVSTSSLDFGEIPLGQFSDRSVYIQNNGNKTLTVNRIYTNNQYYVIQGDTSLSLNPGSGHSINLRFNSIEKGPYSNKLFILSDDPDEGNVSIDLSSYAFAVNELHGLSASGRSGYKITIPFKINNMEEFVGFQFDLLLPNVLSYVNGSARLSTRKTDHQVSANSISNNKLRVVSFSINNQPFQDNDGEILYLDFMLNGNGGNYNYSLDSVFITNANAENIVSEYYSSYINIASPDIDGSLSINMGEVSAVDTAFYNYRINNYGNDTLKITSIVFNNNSFFTDVNSPIIITQGNYYDLPLYFTNPQKGNYSGKLTIRSNDPDEDPFIVNLSAVSFAPNYLKVENINAVVGDTVKLYLSIDNYEDFVAFQTDLTITNNLTYLNNSAKLTDRANGHSISVGNNGNNSLRIIAFSLNQNSFIGNSGSVAELSFVTSAPIGSYDLLLNNSIISNQASENIIKSSINGTVVLERLSAPVLISPLNEELGLLTPISLKWNKVYKAASYKLEISKDNSFASPIITESLLTDTTYVINNLEDLTSYYWRVKGENIGGESAWSEVRSFRTLGTPTEVILLSPANNSLNQSINQLFVWTHAKDQLRKMLNKEVNEIQTVSNYWFELSTDTTKTSYLIDTTLTDSTKTVNGLSYLTDYYWRVRSKNEVGWSGFTGWNKFTTIIENPSEVLLVSPNNNAYGLISPVNLKWKKSFRAAEYRVQLSKNNDFGSTIIDSVILSDTSVTLQNLDINSKYYWRVKAINTGGETEWSSVWSFKTLSPPVSVSLLLPENNSINQPVSQLFTWLKLKDEIGYVDKYMFLLNKDTNDNYIMYDSTLTDTIKTINNLDYSTEYFWKVKGKNKAGWGEFSRWSKFTTIVDNPNIPLLIQPQNGNVNQSVNSILKWGTVNGSDKYFIEISKSIDFSSLILSDSTVKTEYQAINLDYITKYYWRIRAKNIGGYSEWSEVWDFTTIIEKPEVVTLSSPLNNSLGNIKPVKINWNQTDRATTYNLQLSIDNSFTTSLVDTTLLTDTSFVLNNLADLTTYYWRVKAVNVGGESVWSTVWSFRTIGVPTVVNLLQPENNSINQSINQMFTWTKANAQLRIALSETINKQGIEKGTNDIQTVGNYWFELSTDTSMTSYLIDSTLIDTTKIVNGLSYLTEYYWKIKSKNEAGWSQFTNWNKFTTIIDNPSVPLLISPNNRSINQPILVELKWSEVGDTEYYNIEISKDSTFTTTLKSDTTSQINYNIGGLEYLTSYYWRLRAKNTGGYSEWSEIWKFTTIIEKPSVVELISPVTNSIGLIKPIKLYWKKSERATGFRLQISKDDSFTSIVVDNASIADTSTEINDLENLVSYYWRVKAVNFGGESDWSTLWSFRTLGQPTVVSLLAPINNAVNQPLAVNFAWSKANDQLRIASPERMTKQGRVKGTNDINDIQTVSNYWFELSIDTTKVSYLIDSTLIDTTKSVTGLSYLTNYYWRVKSKNEAGWSEFTSWYKFTTIIEKPSVVNLSNPANGSLGNITPVTINWNQADRAETYILQVSLENNFTTAIVDTTLLTDTSLTINKLNNLTTYYWRVKAVNVGGESDWSTVWSFRTLGQPTVVSLLYPANNSINQSIIQTFNWTKAKDQLRIASPERITKQGRGKGINDIQTVANYWFELSTDTTNLSYLIDTTLTDTTKSVNGLNYLTDYYWRVKSKNEAGWSGFTSWNKFTTVIEKPEVVQLVAPINNTVGLLNPIRLKWKNSSRSESYSLQLSTTNDFGSTVIDTTLLSDTTITINNLDIYTNFYWRVKGVNIGGESNWSEIWKFTTLGEPLAVELIYPENNTIDQLTDITFIWSKGEEKLKSNSPSKGITKGKSKGKNEIQSIGNYWFELSTDTTKISYLTDSTLVDTAKTVNGLEYFTQYFWRVKSKNEIGWGEFSSWNKFRTKNEIPEAVSLLYPINGVEEAEIPTKLIWKKQARAEKYELQIAKDGQFSEIVLSQNDLIDTSKTYTSEYLTQYYWRVRGINEVGNGSWSSVWQFTTKDNPIITQTIYLPSGWSMISSYLNPTNANLDSILLSIKNNLKIMKNGAGKVYMPEFQLNSIGDWKIEEGYKIYMTASDTLKINGLMINKEENPIILQSGWNLFAYYSDQVQDLETAFSAIKENIVIIKNGAGKVYIPSFGINTIGNLIPGEGYQGYMSAIDTLYYQNMPSVSPLFAKTITYNSSSSTGSNATLILTGEFDNETIINARTVSGKAIGSGKFIDGMAVIDLIGDNSITEEIVEGAIENEGIELTIHNNNNNEIGVKYESVEDLLSNAISTKLLFKSDGLFVINNIEKAPQVFELVQNYPNPFNPSTIISYSLAENSIVKLKIYDALGSLVSELLNSYQEMGSYKVEFNASNLSSGIYFYRLELKNQTFTKKMMLIK